MKIWKFRNQPDKGPCPAGWADKLGVPQVVADLLWQRGLETSAQMDSFLSPGLRHLSPPDCWPGMQEAVDALEQGIREGRNVLIWGDYDVDGITGATLILQTLRFHDVPSSVHLPDRRKEGYGLNIPEIERLAAEEGPGVLLTVDCGISDVKAVERARELGFMVVVSDHHMPPAELPPAHAITNPRLSEDNPCPHLAGVGVAFFLMAALNGKLEAMSGKRMDMRQVLDLVALGTLADMVSLTGQNRILVKNGLLKIAEAKRPGLAELKEASGFSPVAALGAGQVVFNLAPRINAAGRLGSPTLAHDMLLTPSLKIDAEMPFSQASDFTVLKGLELLQPFGIGNPEPIFASLPLRVKKRKAFGHSREHISLEVTEEGSGITLQAKAWRQADQIPENIQGQRIRLAYTPGINAYNGIASVELRVRDWEAL